VHVHELQPRLGDHLLLRRAGALLVRQPKELAVGAGGLLVRELSPHLRDVEEDPRLERYW